jgi:hypothetical protein
MKTYETCSCNKEDIGLQCIYTGFQFVYNGWRWTSDLFLCKRHKTLSIHGSPPTAIAHAPEAEHNHSRFEGFLIMESTYYRQSGSIGKLTLNDHDQAYVNKYHDLTEYELTE